MDAAGEPPRQARHAPSTRVRPLSLTGAPQGRPSTRRRPSAEPGAPARPPSGSDPRELRFAEGRIARVGGGAKLSRRCRSSSGLRAPPLRAAAASAAATSGSLCCGRPRGPWLNAGVSFWVRYLLLLWWWWWSPAGPGPRVALEVRGRLSAAPRMYVREVCVRLSLGGTPAVSLGCLSITAQGTKTPQNKRRSACGSRHAAGETLAQCSLRYSVRDGASMREVPRIGMASLPLPLAPSARSTSSADTCGRAGTA